MTEDLYNNFNIVQNKTLILKPPYLLNEYNSLCFIVGAWDGDGSIFYSKRRNKKVLMMSYVGTEELCIWIKDKLGNFGSIHHKADCDEAIYCYQVYHTQAIPIINKLRSIKELEKLRFSRKWDKVLEFENLNVR